MGKFKFVETGIKDLWIIEPKVFEMSEGFSWSFTTRGISKRLD